MKVLLLGVTGNVGSRMLPALLAHNQKVVVYARSSSKLSEEVSAKADSIVRGSATDSAAIKAAILAHDCDAVVNAAGLAAMTPFHKEGEFPAIFAAVVKATADARQERGGPPIRTWLLSGWAALDAPRHSYLLVDYVPIYPAHKKNYELIQTTSPDDLAWSLFCASSMLPKHPTPSFPPPADASANNLIAKADAPPDFKDSYLSIPVIGPYLNLLTQAKAYFTTLEDVADFIAKDLELGLKSEFVGKRVGVKEKSKAA